MRKAKEFHSVIASCDSYTSLAFQVLTNFPRAPITGWTHSNPKPIILLLFHNIDIISSNFRYAFSMALFLAPEYIHKTMGHL